MRRVILESPYAGDVERNLAGVLDDNKSEERKLGIEAGLAWGSLAEATVVYTDRGISGGMKFGIERAGKESRPVEYRKLYESKTE